MWPHCNMPLRSLHNMLIGLRKPSLAGRLSVRYTLVREGHDLLGRRSEGSNRITNRSSVTKYYEHMQNMRNTWLRRYLPKLRSKDGRRRFVRATRIRFSS